MTRGEIVRRPFFAHSMLAFNIQDQMIIYMSEDYVSHFVEKCEEHLI